MQGSGEDEDEVDVGREDGERRVRALLQCIWYAVRKASVLSPVAAVEKDLEMGRNVNRNAGMMTRRL